MSRGKIIEDATAKAAAKGKKPPNMDPNKPIKGEFDVAETMAEIRKEIAAGEKVIIDAEGLTPADLTTLKEAVTNGGLDGSVIFHD